MKIIIPVSAHDSHRIGKHARVLKKLGGLETHQVIYFTAPSVQQDAHDTAKILGAQVVVMHVEPKTGWPVGSNQMFSAAVSWLGATGNTSPFLWMELDMLPVKPGWASRLEQEYAIKGKPFLGNLVPFGVSKNGEIHYTEGDNMLMGCALYPPGMHSDERIRWAIANLGKPEGMQPRINGHMIGFDVYLRHPVRVIGAADTTLISDQWNTGNYYETEAGLVCEPLPFALPHRPRGGVVPRETVLVHGCKDDTLVDMLLEPPSHEAQETFAPTKPQDWVNARPTMVEGGELPVVRVVSVRQNTDTPVSAGKTTATTFEVAKPKPVKAATTPAAPTSDALSLKDEIELALKGKKLTVGELAREVGVNSARLRRQLDGLGFMLTPSGFVKAKKPKVSLDDL
jgi:hypothetical protein